MKFPFPTIKVGDHVALVRNDKPCFKRMLISFAGEMWDVPRLSFHLNVKPVPRKHPLGRRCCEGLICHICNTSWCLNPKHLYLGTKSSNQLDFYATERGNQRRQEVSDWSNELVYIDGVLKKRASLSDASVEKKAAWHRGKKRSVETCRLIGLASKGRYKSPASKKKASASALAAWANGKYADRKSTKGKPWSKARRLALEVKRKAGCSTNSLKGKPWSATRRLMWLKNKSLLTQWML